MPREANTQDGDRQYDAGELVELALKANPCIKCPASSCALARKIIGTRATGKQLKEWHKRRKELGDPDA